MKSAPGAHHVSSLDLPALQPYRTLRRPMDHIKEGIFVAEGEKVVRRLLASRLEVVSLLMTQEWHEALEMSGAFGIPAPDRAPAMLFIADKRLLQSIVGYDLHQGIMAVGRVPRSQPIGTLLNAISHPLLLVALDNLVNAENVGVVVRNCAAFGADAILVGETSSSPYLRRAVRNSMGAVFEMPVVQAGDLAGELAFLHEHHGVDIIAAHPGGGTAIAETRLDGNTCIVLGHEGTGISERVLAVCTARVAIPMMNGTDSLNVASASAVFLYEARAQRRRAPG